MAVIVASASQASGATTTSANTSFASGGDSVITRCTNGATPPTQACQVILLLSPDNVTYYRVDSRWFGMAASGVYFQGFDMRDYADIADRFGLLLPWLWYKIQFSGNVGAAVTVQADSSGT